MVRTLLSWVIAAFLEKSLFNLDTHLTNCSRGIRNAWHFYYALIFVIKVVCGGIGIALLTP
ncbi:hypothetical protein BTN99_23395 [Vibrio campbellii]|nr:hypothetical protein BTN99_23395 [Vibrio campbellii]